MFSSYLLKEVHFWQFITTIRSLLTFFSRLKSKVRNHDRTFIRQMLVWKTGWVCFPALLSSCMLFDKFRGLYLCRRQLTERRNPMAMHLVKSQRTWLTNGICSRNWLGNLRFCPTVLHLYRPLLKPQKQKLLLIRTNQRWKTNNKNRKQIRAEAGWAKISCSFKWKLLFQDLWSSIKTHPGNNVEANCFHCGRIFIETLDVSDKRFWIHQWSSFQFGGGRRRSQFIGRIEFWIFFVRVINRSKTQEKEKIFERGEKQKRQGRKKET